MAASGVVYIDFVHFWETWPFDETAPPLGCWEKDFAIKFSFKIFDKFSLINEKIHFVQNISRAHWNSVFFTLVFKAKWF